MCKIKLKNVPPGTSGECDGTLLDSPDILSDSGIIDGSGDVDDSGNMNGSGDVVDDSGNIANKGYISIMPGGEIILISALIGFSVEVSWGSGDINLPLDYISEGETGLRPCVPVTFKLLNHTAPEANIWDISMHYYWITPITVRITINYKYKEYPDVIIEERAFGLFTIPYVYHAPEPPKPDETE